MVRLPVCGPPPAPPLPEEHRPLPPPGGLLDEALALWLADGRCCFCPKPSSPVS